MMQYKVIDSVKCFVGDRFMNLKLVSETSFSQIQRLYCLPAIDDFWKEVNASMLAELQDKPLIIAGTKPITFNQADSIRKSDIAGQIIIVMDQMTF